MMALWRKSLQFIKVMLANRSPMSVAERGSGRLTNAKNKKLSELKPARNAHSCHITNIEPLAPGLTLILRSLAGYSCNAQ